MLGSRRKNYVIIAAVILFAAFALWRTFIYQQTFNLPGNMAQGFVVDKRPIFLGSNVYHNVGLENQDAFDYVEYASPKTISAIKALYDDFFVKNGWNIVNEIGDNEHGYVIAATINDPKLGYDNAPTTQANLTIAPLATSTKVIIIYFHAGEKYYQTHVSSGTQK